jgi:lactoylglutathione lyase
MRLDKVSEFKSERENVDEDILTEGKGILAKIEVDFMAPLDPEKSLKVNVPTLNHIGLWIDELHGIDNQLKGP